MMKFLLCLAVMLATLESGSALACSCRLVPETVEEHIEQNDVIFRGRAIGTHPILVWDDGVEVIRSTKFLVLSALKGVESELPVDTPSYIFVRHWPGVENDGGASCGINFVKGNVYRVFANTFEKKHYTSDCNFTRRESDASTPWEEYERAAATLKQ